MKDILELLSVGGPTLTGVAFGGAVLALFWKGDEAISQQARATLSSWLQRLKTPRSPPSWPDNFIAIFDRIFGKKHLSWRCFGMSCLASLAAVLFVTVAFIATEPLESIEPPPSMRELFQVFGIFVGLGSVCNFVPDYFSLLETRLILDKVRSGTSRIAVFIWLLLDVVATALIFIVPVTIIWSPAVVGVLGYITTWRDLLDRFSMLIGFNAGLSIYFYTTFFTSFWIWVYVAARALVRGLAVSGPTLRILQWALPIRSKPVRSIGEVAGVLCCVGYWIFVYVVGMDPTSAAP